MQDPFIVLTRELEQQRLVMTNVFWTGGLIFHYILTLHGVGGGCCHYMLVLPFVLTKNIYVQRSFCCHTCCCCMKIFVRGGYINIPEEERKLDVVVIVVVIDACWWYELTRIVFVQESILNAPPSQLFAQTQILQLNMNFFFILQ